jgi:crotonobetainyl-CoA:carnitine CoA-transferase CaiB-like acyl-CoA transferase
MALLLEGITILDLTRLLPGPYGTIMAQPGTPLHLSGETRRRHEPPPTLGQYTASIRSLAGYSAREIAALRAAGVIR